MPTLDRLRYLVVARHSGEVVAAFRDVGDALRFLHLLSAVAYMVVGRNPPATIGPEETQRPCGASACG